MVGLRKRTDLDWTRPIRGAALLGGALLMGCSGAPDSDEGPAGQVTQRATNAAEQSQAGALRAAQAQAIADRYIVVFNSGVVRGRAPAAAANVTRSIERSYGAAVSHTYQHALEGVALRIPQAQLARLRQDSRVKYVVPDGIAVAIDDQPNATWGLDRIDQRDLPLNQTYGYIGTGLGVHVYVIDTGVYSGHNEFANRVLDGIDMIDNDSDPDDCHGHGTHVSGTVLGTTYGVAKEATLHGVRVLNCSGSGTWAQVIAGIDWVTANHISPAVANMSLGGSFNQALNDAVAGSVAAGVTYAVAAGNSSANACSYSPAATPEALTVAASDNQDARASFSNYGTCVDVYAPGVDVTSAFPGAPDATQTWSGTSMASPHVAGAAALILGGSPNATPQEVMAQLIALATQGKITNPGSGTPNRLLYSAEFGNASRGSLSVVGAAACGSSVSVTLNDQDLEGTGSQELDLTTSGGDSETLTLGEDETDLGKFQVDLALTVEDVVVGDGVVQIADGDQVEITYEDADSGAGVPATVTKTITLDCAGPDILNVGVKSASGSAAVVGCEVSEKAALRADYGLECDALTASSLFGEASLAPQTTLGGLQKATTYYYTVTAVDSLGNETTDDNGGNCYSLATADQAFFEDFEAGLGLFTVESGLWHASSACQSSLTGHSQPQTLYYGQDASCDYATGSTNSGFVRSVPVTVNFDAGPSLQFNYFLGTEGGSTWDRASAQISVDGATPIVVASSYGTGVALTANSGAWQQASIDLSSLGTGSGVIEILFHFNTVDSILNNYPGFYVDDVVVSEQVTGCTSDADCDDGVDCTVDSCDLNTGTCANAPDHAVCDDGLFCNGIEVCSATGCGAGAVPGCDDGIDCTVDSCDEDTDSCSSIADDAQCDNGAYCDGTETCDPDAGCMPGDPVVCEDGIACTVDSCDEAADQCVVTPDDTVCDDADACNGTEICDVALGCQAGEALDCDDGNVCTTDSCNAAAGCQYSNNTNPCQDDGSSCTDDVCSGGVCAHPDNGSCAQGPFQESGGMVVMEAEHYDAAFARASHEWSLTTDASASNGQVMVATPNNGTTVNTGYVTGSPQMNYPVKFTTTGTYYVWVRGVGPTGNDDSCHAGIDDTGPSSADRMNGFTSSLSWRKSTMDGPVATISVTTAGLHTIHLWMREDGLRADKLLLTTNSSYTPSDAGPAESPRVTGCASDAQCDDGNACTTDTCVAGACQNSAVPNGAACTDDGNSCTDDVCSSGVCTHPSNGSCNSTPCSAYCPNPVNFNVNGSYSSGNLGTAATCHETSSTIHGGNCGNFSSGRTLRVNGTQMTCGGGNWSSLPAKVNGGYCVYTTAGDYAWAYFTLW